MVMAHQVSRDKYQICLAPALGLLSVSSYFKANVLDRQSKALLDSGNMIPALWEDYLAVVCLGQSGSDIDHLMALA